MRWFYGVVLAICGLAMMIGGCKKPYNVTLINASLDEIRDVKLDWGQGNQSMGDVGFRKEQTLGPLFSRPPEMTTLTWNDGGTTRSATAAVPSAPPNFDGTFFILLKDDAITVTAVPYGDKQTYEQLRRQVPDPPML
jgi:hypothetical protein